MLKMLEAKPLLRGRSKAGRGYAAAEIQLIEFHNPTPKSLAGVVAYDPPTAIDCQSTAML
jgi:hypothetical protein